LQLSRSIAGKMRDLQELRERDQDQELRK
jgi:hypothetical protein